MTAILEIEKGSFSSPPKFELIEIDIAVASCSAGDVIFAGGKAYSVQFVAHFPSGSYPVVEKVSRAYSRSIVDLVGKSVHATND